jgi:hypothetical protein
LIAIKSVAAMYVFEKWYFDFLTPQSDFGFVFFASVRFAGIGLTSLMVHLTRAERATVQTESISTPQRMARTDPPEDLRLQWQAGAIETGSSGWRLNFATATGSVCLDYHATPGLRFTPVIIPAGASGSILWKPLSINCAVSGRVALGSEDFEISGAAGYVDYLQSTCLPWRVPVRSLYWGRHIGADLQLAYMHAKDGSGAPPWSGLYGKREGVCFQADRAMLTMPESSSAAPNKPADYCLSADLPSGEVKLRVRHGSLLQEGSFINRQTLPSPLIRGLLRLVARNPSSTKFLSRADVDLQLNGTCVRQCDLPLVNEFALL